MSADVDSGAPPFDPDSLQSRVPTERPRDGGWVRRCLRTFLGVLRSPRTLLERCPEPINHGAALRYLASLRLVPWLLLVGWLGVSWVMSPEREVAPSRGIHVFADPSLLEASSVWLLLMVPVGMPLLYFVCGLISHVAVGLTGGASRSVGASMRAVGYAMGPALLGIAVTDIVLFTTGLQATLFAALVAVLLLVFLRNAAWGLAGTHQIHLVRALLVSLLPAAVLLVAFMGRALPLLDDVPWLPEPPSPYVVP